jgi:thiol-disulfide isomerase/thioredoxin
MEKKKILKTIIIIVVIVGFLALSIILSKNTKSNTNTNSGTTTTTTTKRPDSLKEMTEKDITTNSKKLNIYVFWGNGCPHCEELGEFLDSISADYGKYYDLYTFEVWYNSDNSALMKKFAKALGDDVQGVPYFIIGSKSYSGFASSEEDEIKSQIKTQYNKKTRVDIYKDKVAK